MKPNTTPSTGFPFPADFCGLNDLIWRLKDEAANMEDLASFDAIYGIVQELYRLQDGLGLLAYDRAGKSKQEIDLFLDLLRGFKAREGQ